jgi:Uma2 family endonuclease
MLPSRISEGIKVLGKSLNWDMKTVMDSPPRTMMEVYKMLPEGTLAELIDNVLYMSPSPRAKHQTILNEINFQLLHYFKDNKTGMVYISPLDVYLDSDKNVVQPDLIIVLNETMHILKDDYIHGVPDMIIEILSPGNQKHDLVRKKDLYERFGVKEYWIVNPDNKLAIGFELKDKMYQLITEDAGLIKSRLLQRSFTF